MGQQRVAAMAAERDDRDVRTDIWAALNECTRRERDAVSREQVLRELLDEAHCRIRTLEATLERLNGHDERTRERKRDEDDWVE
jgi:hypothetical protein